MKKPNGADLPPHPFDLVSENLDTERKRLVKIFHLKPDTTLRQAGTWPKSKDAFEAEEKSLRIHFIDRLRILLIYWKVDSEALEMAIGKPHLSDETSWSDIDEVIQRVLMADYGDSLLPARDELAEALGFPADKYNDLIECVERGVANERGYRTLR